MQASFRLGLGLLALLSFLALIAPRSQAFVDAPGKVIKCTSSRIKDQQVCLIQAKNLRLGSQIFIFTPDHYWVASGNLSQVRGDYGLAVFQNNKASIHKDFLVQTDKVREKAVDWSYAFSGR